MESQKGLNFVLLIGGKMRETMIGLQELVGSDCSCGRMPRKYHRND
jgi:hypothetical protein